MDLEMSKLLWCAPVIMVLGAYLLIRCIAGLRKLIVPRIMQRFAASERPERVSLPDPGRYTISVVIPPRVLISGVSYFAARFSAHSCADGKAITCTPRLRFNPFTTSRNDLRGNKMESVAYLTCPQGGDYVITCLNPESIRPDYLLEISPYVSPLQVIPLVLGTIISSAMTIGGLIFFLLKLSGRM